MSALSLIALLASTVTSAATLHGRVVSIADGDTITIIDAQHQQHKIWLQGIDAPESRQSFGKLSKHNLSTLVFRRDVAVEYFKLDRYGRAVGKVTIGDLDVNLAQVRAGLAWVYTDYEDELAPSDRSSTMPQSDKRVPFARAFGQSPLRCHHGYFAGKRTPLVLIRHAAALPRPRRHQPLRVP